MKKISFMIAIFAGLALSACNSNTAKTGNAVADSGSAGSSGAGDTTQAIKGSSGTTGTSAAGNSSGSDTTKTSH
ncbi:hypothetical protein [uncultured Mucilaginibacter sp.]|uniref:hypothetical protein n=1 Tax=uncultured Mucilaginibacter sp. TaxID=797541 RepID=UPI00261AA677|nr:hypothetical protein [uncultured Mucilaginibacter sp.]